MTTELATTSQHLTVQDIKAGVQLAQQVMESVMKVDVHYGKIPGTPKPTLYKAGAEKILSVFRVAVCPVVEDLSTQDEIRYRVHAEGRDSTGALIGTGIGECSTNEEKYKWRKAVCKEEFEFTPDNMKRTKFAKSKDGHYTVDQIRTSPADLANTVLKMAKKRAMVDLTLTATACSDVFDQDLEDLPAEVVEGFGGNGATGGKPAVKQPEEQGGDFGLDGQKISEGQYNMLVTRLEEAGLLVADLCKFMKVEALTDIDSNNLNDAVRAISDGKI